MEIKIDSEMVNQVVTNAIIKSALGQNLEAEINKQIKESISGYRSPVGDLIQKFIREAIQAVLRDNFQEQIRESIAKTLTNNHVEKLVESAVVIAIKKMEDRDY